MTIIKLWPILWSKGYNIITYTNEFFRNAKKNLDHYGSLWISQNMFKCLNLNDNILPKH